MSNFNKLQKITQYVILAGLTTAGISYVGSKVMTSIENANNTVKMRDYELKSDEYNSIKNSVDKGEISTKKALELLQKDAKNKALVIESFNKGVEIGKQKAIDSIKHATDSILNFKNQKFARQDCDKAVSTALKTLIKK